MGHSSSIIEHDDELTPIAKATLPLSASLAKTKRLCKIIQMLIAIGGLVFFAGYAIIWVLLLISSFQSGIDGGAASSLITFFLIGACEAVGAFLAYKIFDDLVRNEAVFTPAQVKRLKGIALVFIVLFAVELIAPNNLMLLSGGEASYVGLANDSSAIPSMPRLNLSSLLFAAVFYCASAIFEYASLLQQASDETI